MEVYKRKYHPEIGESFSCEGVTLITVKDTAPAPCYFKDRGLKCKCEVYACSRSERKDKQNVKFMEVKQNGSK